MASIDIHRELIESCKRGERHAYFELYKLYSSAMYNLALFMVKDEDEAKDVLQDAFISAFDKINTYKGEATFGAWLKRIVVNKSINLIRKRKDFLMRMDETIDLPESLDEQESEHEYDLQRIKSAIHTLPAGYRLVLTLYLLEGYDHKEISEIMNISISTSKSQYIRAKSKLRSILEDKEVNYG